MSLVQVERKNSSLTTILSVFTSMVGGAMLTFPILFRTTGLISSTIVLIISSLISYMSCRVYVVHVRDSQNSIEEMLIRVLGLRWQRIWRVTTSIYLLIQCIIYIDLIIDQLYGVFIYFFDHSGHLDAIGSKDEVVFNKFSLQWLTIALFFPLLSLLFIKNMNLLLRIAQFGAYPSFIYLVFVIYKFFDAVFREGIDMGEVTWFSMNIGNLAGTAGMAFTVSVNVISFIKPNIKQENNVRDVGLSYVLGFLLYQSLGVVGSLAIANKDCKETLVNCYLKEWTVLIVEITYLLGRIAIYPSMLEVARTRTLEFFLPQIEQKHFRNFNIGFMIIACLFGISSPYIPISVLMNLIGAVFAYYFIYLAPAMIQYRTLFKPLSPLEESIIEETQSESQIEDTDSNQVKAKETSSVGSRKLILGVYIFLNFVGVAIGVYGLYSVVKQIIDLV